jgi:hypothetical protein
MWNMVSDSTLASWALMNPRGIMLTKLNASSQALRLTVQVWRKIVAHSIQNPTLQHELGPPVKPGSALHPRGQQRANNRKWHDIRGLAKLPCLSQLLKGIQDTYFEHAAHEITPDRRSWAIIHAVPSHTMQENRDASTGACHSSTMREGAQNL